MKIAIAGPTGNTGRHLIRELQERGGHELVLLARDPAKLREEASRGARVVECSLEDVDAVKGATRGTDALFWMIPPDMTATDPRAHQRRVARSGAEACRANAIPHVVLLSSIGGHLESGTGPIAGLHDAEEIFREAASGLTILRPGSFMENYFLQLDALRESQSVFFPVPGDVRVPMIATRDIARAAADALTGAVPARARIVPLHGPRDYRFDEAAQLISEALGRPVRHVEISHEQGKNALVGMGLSPATADMMLELYAAMRTGHVRAEFPRSPETTTETTFEEFARTTLAPLIQRR
jgi:uncharacterized protein YbjT (DUF2867 family)